MRSTAPGILDSLDLPEKEVTEPDAPRHERVFSIVTSGSGQVRRLPSLFFYSVHLRADRELDTTKGILTTTAGMIVSAEEHPTFMLTACKIGDRMGLYSRDFFNRSVFRRGLTRLGMEFAAMGFVTMSDEGLFETEGWAPFAPSFVILGTSDDDPDHVVVTTGGLLLWGLTSFAVSAMQPADLRRLAHVTKTVDAIGANNEKALVDHLQSSSPRPR